jgi:hypothetical protein
MPAEAGKADHLPESQVGVRAPNTPLVFRNPHIIIGIIIDPMTGGLPTSSDQTT